MGVNRTFFPESPLGSADSLGPLCDADLMDRNVLAYREWLLDQELIRSCESLEQQAFIQLRDMVGAV